MGLVLAIQPVFAGKPGVLSMAQQQRQAMILARTGQSRRALQMLKSLRDKYPNRYSIQRDYILVARWLHDCDRVSDGYRSLQSKYQHYSRVALPAAKCLREQNRVRAAINVLEMTLARNPGSRDIKTELAAAR